MSQKRSDQSRLNGAKSRGPKTPEGKSRSSMNRFRHGRYANNAVVLSNEDRGAYQELVEAYIQRIRPMDPVEMRLARELASIDWRLARILALDTRVLDHEMDVQAPALALENGVVPELTRLVLAARSLVDKSRFPAYLAERETKLALARREPSGPSSPYARITPAPSRRPKSSPRHRSIRKSMSLGGRHKIRIRRSLIPYNPGIR